MATVDVPIILPTALTLQPNIVPQVGINLQPTPYDNDVTLLYKWAEAYQLPIQLIIVRPRTPQDANIISGTTTKVFESLPMIIQRLFNEGESPASVHDIITRYNKLNNITKIRINDIILTYYDIIRRQNHQPDLYVYINQIYRDMDETSIIDKFENQDALDKAYDAWIIQVNVRRERDLKRLDTINEIQLTLEDVDREPKIPFSPITINSTIVSFNPTLDGNPVVAEDGLDIFNRAVTSKYVPFIRYNDKLGKSYFRVYTGGKIETEPNYSITIIPSTKSDKKNTIYMTLWLGDPNSNNSVEIHDAPRESFFTVIYRLETNYLTVEAPIAIDIKKGLIRNENIAFQRTQSALPSIVFGEGKEINVRGDFDIWGMDFDETSFLDMILLEPIMNVYLYVEENIKPFALKKRLDIHYRSIYSDIDEGKTDTEEAYISNSASVSVTLTQNITTFEQTVDVIDPNTNQKTTASLPIGVPYIHVNITQAESRTTVNEFIPIFRLLMRYYLDNRQQIIDDYHALLPELATLNTLLEQRKRKNKAIEPNILALTKKATTHHRVNAKIKRLQEQAPDLFVLNYARRCQCPLQPIIIDNDERDYWRQKRVGPYLQERQIMAFPKDNPKWNFVCPDDNKPYPGVKTNNLSNKDKYPYIPCCFGKDQITEGVNSKYRNYIENKFPANKVGAKAEKKIITGKILAPGKVAALPRAVENIVKRYSNDFADMVRFGVLYTPNSLLHCICVAAPDPNYLEQPTDERKEAYVSRLRLYIMNKINPGLLKQELYDYSDEEIISILGDNNKFLDPSLFYRAIEEVFEINIYVFTPLPPSGDETELGAFEIPRFKIFHARPLRLNRPTVVLMKTTRIGGLGSDPLEYPQCELIVDYDADNNQIVKLFGPEMTEICHSTLQETIRTVTWTLGSNNSFDVNVNIYYFIDHLNLFQLPAVSQFIDYNGKMRAITFDLGNNQLMTVATIPSQPEDLPISTDIHRISADTALHILGGPKGKRLKAVTRDNNGHVDGLWFRILSINYGEYIPIIPTTGYDNKPLGPPNPIISNGVNVTSRLSKLRRTLNIIVQITRWLFDLAKSTQNIDPNTFASTYMFMENKEIQDSSNYYNLSDIPRKLPNVPTVQEAMRRLYRYAPTLFALDPTTGRYRLVMYSAVFADRIIKMLKDYSNLRFGIPPKRAEFIENFYETEEDFINNSNSKIFINEKDLNAWIYSNKSSQNYSRYFNIRDKIEIAMGYAPDPYMYQDKEGKIFNEPNKIFIIQNVIGGNKSKALAVANTWYYYKLNIGSEPVSLDEQPIHMIYGISPSSTLIPIEDHTNGADTFLKLVYYGTQSDKLAGKDARYAAMLEIL